MDKQYYEEYYHLERSHWWFKARAKILKSQVGARAVRGKKNLKILNAGVATGATSTMLEAFGEVTSVEMDPDCCQFLREKLNIEVVQASLTDLPFEDGSFDMVCAFDVIEHIEDDSAALQEINRVLKSHGTVCITVPAYNFLWSRHDEINHHYRRYTAFELRQKMRAELLKPGYFSYFNFFLFPPIALVRAMLNLMRRGKKRQPGDQETTGSDFEVAGKKGLLNTILYWVFLSENRLLSSGLRLPFGVSILCIGKKRR